MQCCFLTRAGVLPHKGKGTDLPVDAGTFSRYNVCMLTHESEGIAMYTSRLQNERTDVLVRALLSLKSEEEVYRVLEDLLTIREVGELSQRLEVAFMLRDKATYSEIVEKTGVSTATIGRVNRCLNYGAGGYQLIFEKLSEEEK